MTWWPVLDRPTTPDWSCFLCRSDISNGDYVRVSWPDGSVRDICSTCVSRADDRESLEERLDWKGELS